MMETNEGKKQVEVPEQIKIGEVTYKIAETPELQNLIKKITTEASIIAASQEKTKLYSNIQALESRVKELEGKSTVPANEHKTNPQNIIPNDSSDKARNEEFKQMMAELSSKNSEVTPEMVAQKMADMFLGAIPDIIKKQIDPVLKMVEESQKEKLETYKERRLVELTGKLIPELVTGTTVEEIEASIEKSVAIFSKYAPKENAGGQSSQEKIEQQSAQAGAEPNRVTAPPAPMRTEMPKDQGAPDIKGMSAEEFSRNRSNLLEKIKREAAAYPAMGQQ